MWWIGPPKIATTMPMMRTQLGEFTKDIQRVLGPLVSPMQSLRDALASASEELPIQAMLPGLRDAHHRLEALLEKVSQQHAYVLIFGPLKSGKSTLMNAFSGSYVSEVTSLPGYPCLTRVRHEEPRGGEERSLSVQRYDGQTERFPDLATMRLHVARAHSELAERIRQAERAGEDFDPEVHLRDAIRTIDVGMPAEGLKRSGAVLVDTPGLYSRMKFHYDRMTRDYRDIAACAIFVVKSDNLFLEQVFEEFDQLLGLFHRVFLVVNLDTTKMDLAQEGGLVPSLEQKEPARVIEAFENLSMSAGMREAQRQGRLKTYAIDLLRAASERLRPEESEPTDQLASTRHASASFDAFVSDLTEYLDGSEFLANFLRDSIRRAETVVEDVRTFVSTPSVGALRRRLEELKARRMVLEGKKRSLDRLRGQNWDESFENLREKLATLSRSRIQEMLERDEEKIGAIVDGWIGSDLSLNDLIEDELKPLFASGRQELIRLVSDALVDEVARPSAGAQVPMGVLEDLRTAGIQLGQLASETASGLEGTLELTDLSKPIQLNDLPIRRKFWELLTFRSKDIVRSKVFGVDRDPKRPVPRAEKAKRLAQGASTVLTAVIRDNEAAFVQRTVSELRAGLVKRYVESLCASLESELDQANVTITSELTTVERQFGEGRHVLSELERLESASKRVLGELVPLESRYSRNVEDLSFDDGTQTVTLTPAGSPATGETTDASVDVPVLEDAETPTDL